MTRLPKGTLMVLFTTLGKIVTNGKTGLPAWGRVAILLAVIVLIGLIVLAAGCSYTSSLTPISGHLSVSTRPA